MSYRKPKPTPFDLNLVGADVTAIERAIRAEEIVLGAVLIDKVAVHTVAPILSDSIMFYRQEHRIIWDVIQRLSLKGMPIDLLTVATEMTNAERDSSGGPAYLSLLTNSVSSAANVEVHARLVWQEHISRELVRACYDTIKALNEGQDIPDTLYGLSHSLYQLQNDGTTGAKPISVIMKEALDAAQALFDRKGDIGTPISDMSSLNKLLGNYEPGDVIIIAGRPKSGKSSVINAILRHHVKEKIPIYLASGEMQNIKTAYRVIADLSRLPTRYVESGKFLGNPADLDSFSTAFDRITPAPAWLNDGELSVPRMRADVHYYFHVHGVKLFIFDRIGLFKEVVNAKDDWNARIQVSSAMRKLANELKVAIIAVSQVNTDAEKTTHKRPDARHIFGGIGLQANCTRALMIYRPEMYRMTTFGDGEFKDEDAKGRVELYTVLNNYMECGSALFTFDKLTQTIREEEGGFYVEPVADTGIPTQDEDLPF